MLTIGTPVTIHTPKLAHIEHVVVGLTTTGAYVAPAKSLTPNDIALAQRGNIPTSSAEWIPAKMIRLESTPAILAK